LKMIPVGDQLAAVALYVRTRPTAKLAPAGRHAQSSC
jgi:hypothetical protein